MGLRNRLKRGDHCRWKSKTWLVFGITSTAEAAQRSLQSNKEWNEKMIAKYGIGGLRGSVKQWEYDVRKRRLTLNYGSIVRFDFLILRREKETQE